MKLYLHTNGLFYEKQADCPSKSFEAVEFPFSATPKADFVTWMNANYSPNIHGGQAVKTELFDETVKTDLADLPVDRHIREQAARPTPPPHQPRPVPHADAVMEWVLDEASPAEIENLFGALGARFHEANRRIVT